MFDVLNTLNSKYLLNVFLYFISVHEFEYVYIVGFYYLLQDYFLIVLSSFGSFVTLGNSYKEELKYFFILTVFISFLM